MNRDRLNPPTALLASRSHSRRSVVKGFGATGIGLLTLAGGRWTRASAQEATPEAVRHELDVVYGEIGGQQLLLDVAMPPAQTELRPAVILIHGGAFMFGSREGIAGLMTPLAEAGYVVFNIDYRLFNPDTKANPWPAQLDDAQRAVRWVRANAAKYGVDPKRIAAFGHSSGAQLAAFLGARDTRDNSDAALGEHSSRAACVIDLAGDMDWTIPYPDPDANAANILILGGTATAPPDQSAYRDFSPIAFVDARTAPFLIMRGGADINVPVEQSSRMVAALQTAGVEVMFGEFPGFDHRGIVDWSAIGPLTLFFLGRHLRAGTSQA